MNRRVLVRSLVVLTVFAAVAAAAAYAGMCFCSPQARGDYQVLENGASGATVRVWIQNPCRCNHQVYVTVVASAADGTSITSAYSLYLPRFGTRPVEVEFPKEIAHVSKIIVTNLGGCSMFR